MFVVDFLLRNNSVLKNCKVYNNSKINKPLTDKDDISHKLTNNKYDYVFIKNNSLDVNLYEHEILNYWIHDINTNVDNLINEYMERN